MMRVVKTLPQDGVFEWIRNGRDKPNAISRASPGWRGNFVSLLIPNAFEAYAKILHRIDVRYEDPTSPLSESEIAILKIPPCTRLREFIEHKRENSQSSRVSWARIAKILEVPIKPEICIQWFHSSAQTSHFCSREVFQNLLHFWNHIDSLSNTGGLQTGGGAYVPTTTLCLPLLGDPNT
jgi:hypothetical protein